MKNPHTPRKKTALIVGANDQARKEQGSVRQEVRLEIVTDIL